MKSILITGGTGSFGQAMVDYLLRFSDFEKIAIYSRDEFKQYQMIQKFGEFPVGRLRFFVGDVRDLKNLRRATRGVDVIIHAAALKQIPSCEYNPWEVVQTNIYGTWNAITAAVENKVRKVIFLSSDKAVNPVNCYGATKLVAEKLIVNSNVLGDRVTRFSVIRYGNVLASRGSVVQAFREQAREGRLKVTDRRMTRFWWNLDDVVKFTYSVIYNTKGGEIFVPKLESSLVMDLARAVCPDVPIEETGIRAGEKIHETLIAPDEVRRTYDERWSYVISPDNPFFQYEESFYGLVPEDFSYTSDNPQFCRKEFGNL